MSFCPKTFTVTEDPKANPVGEKCKKVLRNSETSLKKWWGNLPRNLVAPQNRSAPEGQRDHETCATLVEPSAEPFGRTRRSAPEDQRDNETCATLVKPWWNLGGTLVHPWWNLGETLVEPSAEPSGGPRRICPREAERESESNSAPKPLLWLKTPKLLLLGKNLLPLTNSHRLKSPQKTRIFYNWLTD